MRKEKKAPWPKIIFSNFFALFMRCVIGKSVAISFALMLCSINQFAYAQQTCASRKEAGATAFSKYTLKMKNDIRQREIMLRCTEREGVVKVDLRDKKTGRVLQSFEENQEQTYLDASTPDLDNDGYSDLVLVTAWGSPNMTFKAWRYDPAQDRLKVVLEGDGGTEFVRTKSGDVVIYAKCGADLWGYTIFKWKRNRLVRTYSIEEKVGDSDSSPCKYYDLIDTENAKEVKDAKTLNYLKRYCGIGGAGLVEQGEGLLPH